MADNTRLSTNSGEGDLLATKEVTHGGDSTKLQTVSLVGVSGSEGAYTIADIDGCATYGLDVDVTRSVLPTGAATGAKQDTGNTALAAIQTAVEGTLTVGSHEVTNAGTFAVQLDGDALTALELIDDLVLTEDAVHGSGDKGVMALVVRNDSLAALAGADGDYAPLQVNASGALYVAVSGSVTVGSHAVTNAGTFAVQVDGDALTALQLIDDAIHAEDDAHSGGDKGALVLAVRNDTPGALAGADGDYIPLTTDSTGRLYVLAAQTGTWNVGTVTAVTAITSALPAGDNNIGNVDVASALPAGTNTIGGVIAASQSDSAYDGTTSCTIKRFNVVATADGDTVVAAPTGTKKIRFRGFNVLGISTTGTTVYFRTATTNTAFLGNSSHPIPIGVDADGNNFGGIFPPFNPDGMFETADADEAVEIKMPGGAQAMQVWGSYIEVD